MPRDRHLVEQWLGRDPADIMKKQNIQQDRYDHTIFNEIHDGSEKMQSLNPTGTFPELLQDFWASFYKMQPELEKEENLNPAHRVNRPFVERLLEDSTTKETRITTALDELSSAVAAIAASEKIAEEIHSRESLRNAMTCARAAMAVPEKEQSAEERAQAKAGVEKALEMLDGAARDVRRAVREAVRAGQESAEEVQSAMIGWGLDPAEINRMPIKDQLRLADLLTKDRQMRQIADMVGRMRNLARARQRQKKKRQRDEIHNITIGKEIPHLLPQELAALRHPLRRADFYRRFTEGRLLQYDLKSRERAARGPIVAMIDISGSMSGEPIEWAIAVALALLDTAQRQKRICNILFFNTTVEKVHSFDGRKKGDALEHAKQIAEIATIGASGGTDYTHAVAHAMNVISTQKDCENADMVMVTDGLCSMDEDIIKMFTEWKKKSGIHSYAILINSRTGGVVRELDTWNDKVWNVRAWEDKDHAAGEMFEEIGQKQ